jgi:hypothetical protein
MGRTACTEPKCLYKGALKIFFLIKIHLPNTFCGALLKYCRDADPIAQNKCDDTAAAS